MINIFDLFGNVLSAFVNGITSFTDNIDGTVGEWLSSIETESEWLSTLIGWLTDWEGFANLTSLDLIFGSLAVVVAVHLFYFLLPLD